MLRRASLRTLVQWWPLALYPAISIAVINRKFISSGWEVVACVALGVAVSTAVSLLFALLVDDERWSACAAFAAVVFLLYFGYYLHGYDALGLFRPPVWFQLTLWTALCVTLAFALMVGQQRWSGTLGFLRRFSLIFLAMPLLSALVTSARAADRLSEARSVAAAAPTSVARRDSASRAKLPNIYLLVLDKYSGTRPLRDNLRFDNSAIERELRQRGFFVPTRPRANYMHTSLAVAALLDMAYHDSTGGGRETMGSGGHMLLFQEIAESRAIRLLRQAGYRFVFLPSTFPGTTANSQADLVLSVREHRSIGVLQAWEGMTILEGVRGLSQAAEGRESVSPFPTETAEDLTWKFRMMETLPDSQGPLFVFAHIMDPHEPYVFGDGCRPAPPYWPKSDQGASRRYWPSAYVREISCLNRLLVQLADTLRARSATPPVILFQADHGHGGIATNALIGEDLPLSALPASSIRERTSVFAAYYLPGDGAKAAYDSITPVNVLPLVLRTYVGLDVPPLPDRTYWSTFEEPFKFTDLTGKYVP